MNRRLFAFSFFIFPPSSRVLMHANNYGHYHGLCRDKFTKTPRRGRVETLLPLLPAFYAILTHSRAKSSTGLCYSSVVSGISDFGPGSGGHGTFDMRVFTNRTSGPAVGKLHIPMYALGQRICARHCVSSYPSSEPWTSRGGLPATA